MLSGAKAATTKSSMGVADIGATLAAFGLTRKPHVAIGQKWHRGVVRRREKKIHWDKIKTDTQRIFVVRVNELMDGKGMSDNQLSVVCEGLGLAGGQSS